MTLNEFIKPSNGVESKDNRLNDLSGKDWIKETCTVWFQKGLGKGHEHTVLERQHPAPFSFQDIARLIKFFTHENEVVLDPFCGVASALKACALIGREGIGIELSNKWAKLGRVRLKREVKDSKKQKIILGDARRILPKFTSRSIDYIVTSPPYWNILSKKPDHKVKRERLKLGLKTKYSEDPKDLGNIRNYEDFLHELAKCFSECYRILKPKKYITVVVSDFRHKSTYYAFHSDMIEIMDTIGFKLKGITILVQNQKSLYPYGYPYAYVPNIHHQYILTFRKDS